MKSAKKPIESHKDKIKHWNELSKDLQRGLVVSLFRDRYDRFCLN